MMYKDTKTKINLYSSLMVSFNSLKIDFLLSMTSPYNNYNKEKEKYEKNLSKYTDTCHISVIIVV